MPGFLSSRPALVAGLQILGVAAAYYLAAKLGLMAGVIRSQISPFWPPTGVALVALLVLGPRVWPGVLLGAYLTTADIVLWYYALPTAIGQLLGPLIGYILLRRVGFRLELDRLRDAFALVLLGGFVAMTVSASAGNAVRVAAGEVPASAFWSSWLTWWTGDVMGVLALAPFFLALYALRWRPRNLAWYRWLELAVLLVGSYVSVLYGAKLLGALFLGFPILIWAAFRFRLAGTAPCVLLSSIACIEAALAGYPPFAGRELLPEMVTLQLFNGCVALTGLLLAVAITERDHARLDVERTATTLGAVVDRLGHATRPRIGERGTAERPDNDVHPDPDSEPA